ncbi:MAG: LamG-like jellyroll fold domain-containing protein [Planctomycetota bacterium]
MGASNTAAWRIALGLCVLILCQTNARAEVTELARFSLGEDAAGSPARLVSADGTLTLEAVGSPETIEDVSTEAARQTGSRLAVRLDAGEGYRLEGLPEEYRGQLGVELWVRPTPQEGFRNAANYGGGTGLGVALNNDGGWGVVYGKATVGWSQLGPGRWVHLAVVQDGGQASFFVDGKPAGVANNAESWGFPADRPLLLGLPVEPDKHRPFAGDLDELRVFTFAPGAFDPTDLLVFGGGRPSGDVLEPTGVAAEAWVDFSKPQPENGLTFDRGTGEPATAEGKRAWKSDRQTNPSMGWVKEFNLRFTDERFRDGKMPVVDVEALVRLDTWAGVHAYGDTASSGGHEELAWLWGGDPQWKLLRFELDDAHFGARDFGNPPTAHRSDGFDLRLFGANEPMFVHRVAVTGYRRSGDVDWSRLLRARRPLGVATHGDAGNLMFERSAPARLRFAVRNLALQDTRARWSLRVLDEQGQTKARQNGTVTLDAEGDSTFDAEFDVSDWPLGSYRYAYRLEHDEHSTPVAAIDGRLGVYQGGPAPRLGDVDGDKPGGFLYGMQAVIGPLVPHNAAWLDLLGVDILREGTLNYQKADPAEQQRVTEALAQRDIHLLAKIDPPLPGSPVNYLPDGLTPEEEVRERAKAAAHCRRVGRTLGDRLYYYEIGNEPDLPFFYPGPIEEYAESFRVMRAAIHEADPDAVVMNGGVCFHSAIGYERAHQLIELLADDVDAWAYHAHGPGFEAERDRYEMLRAATDAVGKSHLPVVETETGVAASGEIQLQEQARTAVEKFVYCMSKDMPLMIFFALHFQGGDGGYTMIEADHEPRPVVLAYRNIVKTLRTSRYADAVEALSDTAHGHRFVDPDTGRQTLVLWSTAEQPEPVRIDLGTERSDITRIDLMGNREAMPIEAGVASFALGADAVYLTWSDGQVDAGPALAGLPPLLESPTEARAVGGETLTFDALVRPHGATPADRVLRARLVLADAEVDTRVIDVPAPSAGADEAMTVPVSLDVPATFSRLTWPATWRVGFSDLPSFGSPWVSMNGSIDLAELAGDFAERDAAVVGSRVWSDRDQRVTVGASADWWMAWRVNGRPVYDTLERGNQSGASPLAHTFEVDLKRGWNDLEADVLSGSQGWKFLAAGPDTVAAGRRPESPPDRVELTLWEGDPSASAEPLARRVLPVVAVPAITPSSAGGGTPPLAVLGAESVDNPNASHPDTSRWYAGPDDLSAVVWLTADDDAPLTLRIAVRDDQHDPNQDRVTARLRFDDAPPVVVTPRPTPDVGVYVARIDRPDGHRTATLELEITDIDAGFEKQTLRWSQRRVLP